MTLELGNGGTRNGNGTLMTRQRLTWVIREIQSVLNTLHQCLILLLKTGYVMNMRICSLPPLFTYLYQIETIGKCTLLRRLHLEAWYVKVFEFSRDFLTSELESSSKSSSNCVVT